MKKSTFVYIFVLFITLISGYLYFNSTKFIHSWMLYDYIEYENMVYIRVTTADFPEGWEYGEDLQPVYIIDSSMKKRTDITYSATEIVGDEGERYLDSNGKIMYLFFDSAEWKLDDSIK